MNIYVIQKFKKLNDSSCIHLAFAVICVENATSISAFAFMNSNILLSHWTFKETVRSWRLDAYNHIPFWISIKSWWIAKQWCMDSCICCFAAALEEVNVYHLNSSTTNCYVRLIVSIRLPYKARKKSWLKVTTVVNCDLWIINKIK